MPFTFKIEDLKKRAGTDVFNRGIKYFQNGLVSEIKTVVDTYTAKVHGRHIYHVEYSPDEDSFSCDCPYDGFCKHLVAFGLKLLDEKEQLTHTKNFNTWYQSINDEIKIHFLERLVRNDRSLKEKLDRMSRQTEDNDTPVSINDIAEAVYSEIDRLTYDDVLESFEGYNYYVEEYVVIDDLVSNVLDNHLSVIGEFVKLEKYDQAFIHILGIYLGLQKSYNTEIAGYMEDLENFLYEPALQFVQSLQKQPDSIKSKIFNRFIAFCEDNSLDNLGFFKDFLLLFLKEHSVRLKEFLLAFPEDNTARGILMTILRRDQDLELMKKLLKKTDPAYLYIPYLDLLKTKGEFEEIKQILLTFYDAFDICTLKEFVLPELGNETYKKLLHRLIVKCFNLAYYKSYKKLLSKDEKRIFLSGIEQDLSYSTESYALPILFHEKIYKPVLKYIKDSTDSEYGFNSFDKYLKKISGTLPVEVWKIYLKRTNFLFEQRARRYYASMTYYLKIMKDIDKEKTERLISTYYNHKPVLRALRDEFEKAGIV